MCVGRSGRVRDSEQWLVVVTVLLEDLLMSDTERGGGDQRWRANQRPVYWSRDHSQPIRGEIRDGEHGPQTLTQLSRSDHSQCVSAREVGAMMATHQPQDPTILLLLLLYHSHIISY